LQNAQCILACIRKCFEHLALHLRSHLLLANADFASHFATQNAIPALFNFFSLNFSTSSFYLKISSFYLAYPLREIINH